MLLCAYLLRCQRKMAKFEWSWGGEMKYLAFRGSTIMSLISSIVQKSQSKWKDNLTLGVRFMKTEYKRKDTMSKVRTTPKYSIFWKFYLKSGGNIWFDSQNGLALSLATTFTSCGPKMCKTKRKVDGMRKFSAVPQPTLHITRPNTNALNSLLLFFFFVLAQLLLTNL